MCRCRIDTLETPGRLAGRRWKGCKASREKQAGNSSRQVGSCQLVPCPARLIKSQSVGQTENPCLSFFFPQRGESKAARPGWIGSRLFCAIPFRRSPAFFRRHRYNAVTVHGLRWSTDENVCRASNPLSHYPICRPHRPIPQDKASSR